MTEPVRLAVVGHSGCGKNVACEWLDANTPLRYRWSTSEFFARRQLGDSPSNGLASLAWYRATPGRRSLLRRLILSYNRRDPDRVRLYAGLVRRQDVLNGIRCLSELAGCKRRGLATHCIWIERDVPDDLTLDYDLAACRKLFGCRLSVIDNRGSLEQLHGGLADWWQFVWMGAIERAGKGL